jgi:hypothetical protein
MTPILHDLIEINPVETRPKADILPMINPRTGNAYGQSGGRMRIKPLQEQALRLYATGVVSSIEAAAVVAKCSSVRLIQLINSPAGQAVVDSVKSELDFRYQSLYKKFIQVVGDAMDHPEPAVALAGASLFAKTQIGTKHKVELSAEDIVQQIINGTYVKE